MADESKKNKIAEFIENILVKLGLKKRKKVKTYDRSLIGIKKLFEEGELEFYEAYTYSGKKVPNLDELIPEDSIFVKSSETITKYVTTSSIFPSKKDFQYIGVSDVKKYFLRILMKGFFAGLIIFIINLVSFDIINGLIQGLIVFILFLLGGIYYPKIKLLLFKGEIKLQVLMAILHIISMLDSGASLQEAIKNIASSSEYGVVSFEFKTIIYDIVRGGYTFLEALERARERTSLEIMRKLYAQLISAVSQGGAQLLLKNLYEEIVRESLSKIDNSKFQITNLGNLIFGTGLILPFAGMLQGALAGGTGFEGVINTVDLVIGKIGLASTVMFAIFVKMKIE